VHVKKGAVIRNAILMQDTVVHSGADLRYVICDKEVKIQENTLLVGHESYPIAISKGAIV